MATVLPSLSGRPVRTAAALRARVRRAVLGFFATLAARERVMLERRRLAELDDRLLQDIGISRADAQRAARRHYWE